MEGKPIMTEQNELVALRARCAWAKRIIAHGEELMTNEQLGKWEGVRTWEELETGDYVDMIADLTAKLEAAENALHGLRIRCAQLQPEGERR